MTSPLSCGIYARISRDDDGTALGVGRQLEDCRELAAQMGWEVAETFVDNSVSATTSKIRPEYVRLFQAVKDKRIQAIVVWDVDRLTRQPRELEDVIDLAKHYKVALASVGGEIDLATPQGQMMARMKGNVARHDVDQQSRRLKRKFQENAAKGLPHGVVPFGYRRELVTDDNGRPAGSRTLIVPEEAEVLREWYRRVLAGESLRTLAKDAKQRGILTQRGNPWPGVTIGRALRRPVYVGQRVHQGEVVGAGNWEPIIDQGIFDRVGAILMDPSRQPSRGLEVRYLGSGIYLCGRCGDALRPVVGKQKRAPAYGCPGCMRLTRKLEPVDDVVEAVIIARLSRPDVVLDLSTDPGALRDAVAARDTLVARMDTAADEYADGAVTARQLARITERMKGDLKAAELRVARLQPVAVLDGMTGPAAAEAWAAASLEKRRAVLRELVTVTILPTGPGVKFAPEQLRFDWKAAGA